MGMTDYTEGKLLGWALRGTSPGSAPATVYAALFTAAPTAAGGGTEVSGGNYARVPLLTASAFTAPGASGVELATPAIFPTPTASWEFIVAWGLYDAPTGGNLLFWGEFAAPVAVSNGDPAPEFQTGDMTVSAT